jgi:Zn-dependent protease with chaperone function
MNIRFLGPKIALALVVASLLAKPAAAQLVTARHNNGPAVATDADGGTGPVEVPPPSEKALNYYHSGNVFWAANVAWGILLPALLAFTGFSAWLRTWARMMARWWFFTVALYVLLFVILMQLLDLPLAYYGGYVRQRAYGLSTQTLGKWFGDYLKGTLVVMIGGIAVLWVPYLLLAKSPKRWWLYTSILAMPFYFFVLLIEPIWIAPLFNDFERMKDRTLEAKILALAERAGIEADHVFEANKSVDTKTANAYVTGFLGTKRIVLWDTLLREPYTQRQVLCVMGHEMGHYVLHHLVLGVLFGSVSTLIALFILNRVVGGLVRRYQDRLRFERMADVASLPLFLLVINVLTLVGEPIGLAFSRYIEHEADRFGLEITQDNHAMAMAFVNFQRNDLGVPRPGWLYKVWRASHPPLGERVDFANEYRPWEEGEPSRYGAYFRQPAR